MDNVLIVVEDLEAAKAFFAELGMELDGETQVEGPWVDRVVGLNGVRADIASSRSTRTNTGSASCVAQRASSSDWPRSLAETSVAESIATAKPAAYRGFSVFRMVGSSVTHRCPHD